MVDTAFDPCATTMSQPFRTNRVVATQCAGKKSQTNFIGSSGLIDATMPYGNAGSKSSRLCPRASQSRHQKNCDYRESLPFHSRKHETVLLPEIIGPAAVRSNVFSDLRKGQQSPYQGECSTTREQYYGKYKKIEHVRLALVGLIMSIRANSGIGSLWQTEFRDLHLKLWRPVQPRDQCGDNWTANEFGRRTTQNFFGFETPNVESGRLLKLIVIQFALALVMHSEPSIYLLRNMCLSGRNRSF